MEHIWIYTLSKELSKEQLTEFKAMCQSFVEDWKAHEVSLVASYELYQDRILIFKVDESNYEASGCSLDSKTRFVKHLEHKFDIELLNRLLVGYIDEANKLHIVKHTQIPELLANQTIHPNTLVLNNSITFASELESNWKVPLSSTWLSKFLVAKSA